MNQRLLEHAQKIPTQDTHHDIDCLSQLIQISPAYFDFCISRFSLLMKKSQQPLSQLQQLIHNETNDNRYLPLLDIILLNINDPEVLSSFIFSLLCDIQKSYSVGFSILNHPSLPIFQNSLCIKLFNFIPDSPLDYSIIHIRDQLLYACNFSDNKNQLALKCLMRIPTFRGFSFYQEFTQLVSYLIERGCTDPTLSIVLIDSILHSTFTLPLLDLFFQSTLPIPQLFLNYIQFNSTLKIPPYDEKRVFDCDIDQLPPFLRIRKIVPFVNQLNGPRFCSVSQNEKNGSWETEIKERIISESDPRMLHDYLLSLNQPIPLKSPFRFTLLASAAIKDLQYTTDYYSEFSTLQPDDDKERLLAASIGLEKISLYDSSAAVTLFSLLRSFLLYCGNQEVRIHLLNTIARSIGNYQIDAEFVWRDYHSIRTVPDEGLDFEDLIHYSVISLNDQFDAELGEEIIPKLLKTDNSGVISGLWKIPTDVLSKFPSVASLLPTFQPTISYKTDLVHQFACDELEKELTTQRMLQLASAFSMFFDAFQRQEKMKVFQTEWIQILVTAGQSIFDMKIDQNFYQRVRANIIDQNVNEKVRFASCFTLALYLSYRLVNPYEDLTIGQDLREVSLNDGSKLVRCISLYATSYTPPPPNSPQMTITSFVDTIYKRGKEKQITEDLIGIGYCMNAWFSYLVQYITDKRNALLRTPKLWPFVKSILIFLGKDTKSDILETDDIGLSQFIYLQRSNPQYDKLISSFLENHHTTPDNILISICGYIPSLAFRINDFSKDERQRKILLTAQSEEFNLINALVTRQRLCHSPSSSITKDKLRTKSLFDKLKNEWMTMHDEEVHMILSALQKNQIGEIVADSNHDSSLFVALALKSDKDVARLLATKKWSNDMMKRVKATYNDESKFAKLINEMCEINAKIELVADVVVFYNLNEQLSESNSLALLPFYLALVSPMTHSIAQYGKQIPYFAHCLLITNVEFFEIHDEFGFSLFV